MDSKMRRTVILAGVVALLAIIAVVVFTNLNTIRKKWNRIICFYAGRNFF